ncbi:uncharacterized protein PV06_09768 [Exophiala oligosperma]|uniref:Uncharacterized protein n=2 Tax=Chaetothyriales TaxID=34395 RepID=A0A0D2DPK6_9EURO|nr:uncharacterized protein PV06_09768 [Exophiala oligosperma]KAJ9632852.1 hypothetical protein H2204_007582 [Knufia peltigerae]KIW37779.1 hypothetical protein PV06_09768 [Exophiala oligosperma]
MSFQGTPAHTRPSATRTNTSSSVMTVSTVCTTPIDEMRNFGDSWFESQAVSVAEYYKQKELRKNPAPALKGYGEAHFEDFAAQYEAYQAKRAAA